MRDRLKQGLVAAVASPQGEPYLAAAGGIEVDGTGPARGARHQGQVLGGTAQRHKHIVIIGVDHWSASLEVGRIVIPVLSGRNSQAT